MCIVMDIRVFVFPFVVYFFSPPKDNMKEWKRSKKREQSKKVLYVGRRKKELKVASGCQSG